MLIYPLFVGTPMEEDAQGFVVCDAPSCLSLPKQNIETTGDAVVGNIFYFGADVIFQRGRSPKNRA